MTVDYIKIPDGFVVKKITDLNSDTITPEMNDTLEKLQKALGLEWPT